MKAPQVPSMAPAVTRRARPQGNPATGEPGTAEQRTENELAMRVIVGPPFSIPLSLIGTFPDHWTLPVAESQPCFSDRVPVLAVGPRSRRGKMAVGLTIRDGSTKWFYWRALSIILAVKGITHVP